MDNRIYRKRVEQSWRKNIGRDVGGNPERKGTGSEVEQDQGDYIHSGRMDLLNDTFKHIITRIKEEPIGNKYIDILFGHDVWGVFKYDCLKIEETELGYAPTKFIYYTENSEKKEIDLFSKIGLDSEDPYEPVFGPISKYFERSGSDIKYGNLVERYINAKERLREHTELTENNVFFVEQRSDWYLSYSK